MTILEACNILDIEENADEETIKKQYRMLMHKAHPDAEAFAEKEKLEHITAQQINEAYEVLKKRKNKKNGKKVQKQKKEGWNAPKNPLAYCERNIFHAVEDEDGATVGFFCVACGKYFWTPDEEFSLFQRSMFLCSKELLDRVEEECGQCGDASLRMATQAELIYLLSAQYIDGIGILKQLPNVSRQEENTFQMTAMLEKTAEKMVVSVGDYLFPKGVKNHRLYLMDQIGNEIGYLSFVDDRLYYVLIPLFEQKSVQIKMKVSDRSESGLPAGKRKKGRKYIYLDLWIKFVQQKNTLPESIGLQIDALLQKYKSCL